MRVELLIVAAAACLLVDFAYAALRVRKRRKAHGELLTWGRKNLAGEKSASGS